MADSRMGQVAMTTEASIQSAIIDYLQLQGLAVFIFAVPGGHRELKGALPEGWPDLVAIHDGEHLYLEVKAPGGRTNKTQREMHQRLWDAGCYCFVVRSLEDMVELLDDLNWERVKVEQIT